MNKKSALISIIGKPNAGKSTLLNRMIGHKISIVTPKVQTTRNMIQGILTLGNTQLIFIDTPGIFEPKKRLEKAMVRCAWSSIVGADIVLVMLDCKEELDELQLQILERLRDNNIKFVLVINKVDLYHGSEGLDQWALRIMCPIGSTSGSEKDELTRQANLKSLEQTSKTTPTFYISAKTGKEVEALEKYLVENAKSREWLYSEDDITNIPMRFLAAEITREQLFFDLQQELPYNLTVETEKWEEFRNGSVKINQVIIVAREGHKAIILGKLKGVGERARAQIKQLLGFEVHLFLFVKVRENWDSNLVQTLGG